VAIEANQEQDGYRGKSRAESPPEPDDTEPEMKSEVQRDGESEILTGLKPGETVVVDGAGMLSDGAKIKVRDSGEATAPAVAMEKKVP